MWSGLGAGKQCDRPIPQLILARLPGRQEGEEGSGQGYQPERRRWPRTELRWNVHQGGRERQAGEIFQSQGEREIERTSKWTRVLTSISRCCTSAVKTRQSEGLSPSWGAFPTSTSAQLQGEEFTPFQMLFMILIMSFH